MHIYMSAYINTYMDKYIHSYAYTHVCLPVYTPKCTHPYSIYVTAYRTAACHMASSSCYTLCSPHAQIMSKSCMPSEQEFHPVTVHAHSSLLPWNHGVCANVSWHHFVCHWPKGIKQHLHGEAGVLWFFLPRDTGKRRPKLLLRNQCALPAWRFWNVTLKGKCLDFLYAIMQAVSAWMGCPLI